MFNNKKINHLFKKNDQKPEQIPHQRYTDGSKHMKDISASYSIIRRI